LALGEEAQRLINGFDRLIPIPLVLWGSWRRGIVEQHDSPWVHL